MPYYKKDLINLLFIHIPKTGGSSLENYFSRIFNIQLDNQSLFLYLNNEKKELINKEANPNIFFLFENTSLQHLTYQNIIDNKDFLKIDMDNLKIISIVRNPYERIISDLFYQNYIEINTDPEKVFEIIQIYLKKINLDNHNIPQYKFLIDNNNNLINNLVLLKTENLSDEIKRIGYEDFCEKDQINMRGKLNYFQYLNNDSIKLINEFYDLDFFYFHYEKK